MSTELVKAMRIDNELKPLINEGVRAAAFATSRIRTAAMRQFRTGKRVNYRRLIYDALYEPLLKGMAVGHLLGDKRAELFVPQRLSLAVYDTMLATLAKKRGLNVSKLRKEYEVQAFKVVTQLGKKVDNELQDTIDELLREGAHIREATTTLTEKFTKLGLTQKSASSVETLFRTQLQTAYGAARWKHDQDPDIQEILWGYKYVTVGDDRVRPEHAALEGVTLPKDDPFWLTFWPPNGWNCRCQAIPIFEERPIVEAPDDVQPDPGFDFNAGLALAFDPNQPRDYHGRFAADKGGASGAVSRHTRTSNPKLSDRAQRAKATHKRSTAAKQRHAEANETYLAKELKAEQSDDNAAMDVVMTSSGVLHGIEVKTMVDNSNDKITMHPNSRRRKEDWKAATRNREVHTVIMDHRAKFGNTHQYSGHEIYYKRGVGAFRLSRMYKVKSVKELKKLIKTPTADLPETAR